MGRHLAALISLAAIAAFLFAAPSAEAVAPDAATTPNTVRAAIGSVLPGQSGTLSFRIDINRRDEDRLRSREAGFKQRLLAVSGNTGGQPGRPSQ